MIFLKHETKNLKREWMKEYVGLEHRSIHHLNHVARKVLWNNCLESVILVHALISGNERQVQSFRCINNNLLDNIGRLKERCFFRKVIPWEEWSIGGDFKSNRLDIWGNHENSERK